MAFNSLTYLFSLTFVVILFWLLSQKAKYFLIFFSSLIFYGFWRIDFIPLLLFSTFTDWWLSQKIYKSNIEHLRKKLVIISLIINLGLLFIGANLFINLPLKSNVPFPLFINLSSLQLHTCLLIYIIFIY